MVEPSCSASPPANDDRHYPVMTKRNSTRAKNSFPFGVLLLRWRTYHGKTIGSAHGTVNNAGVTVCISLIALEKINKFATFFNEICKLTLKNLVSFKKNWKNIVLVCRNRRIKFLSVFQDSQNDSNDNDPFQHEERYCQRIWQVLGILCSY